MASKRSQPYQPLLLRILHGITSLFAIAAIVTAFWTYDIYDGRWGRIYLPKYTEIEGIHGTFGLWTLLIFPLFVFYAFNRGQHRLIDSNSLVKLAEFGKPIWWYTLHRLVNTVSILALTLAVFSGKMMNEKWLPEGELNHVWYYVHLVGWLILVICIAIHLLMNIKVGGVSLILSMFNWRFRSEDSPKLWRRNFSIWRDRFGMSTVKQWLQSRSLLKIIEIFVLVAIILAWIVSLLKELLF
ncbi:cytochrome b/b6 domain-containing protein [Myxosarcina sp. GI1]|uniref:cytochrome b/b6 domain-containing protein n=1 Tax=Myxosarcina sp. GI1 TaxID=1541065 RepID=UPI000563C9C9|nr:cytochrome b/b6 domain-containing protein [Myxosarcina sp. GI1]